MAISAVAFAVILSGGGCASASPALKKSEASIKEFVMTSFVEMKDGKYFPQFSMKELKVKKGDKVRIKVTNTKGSHDINIDEFDIKAETPLNQEVVVEFIADKAGQFVYYCSKPGHRENGHWGALIVEE